MATSIVVLVVLIMVSVKVGGSGVYVRCQFEMCFGRFAAANGGHARWPTMDRQRLMHDIFAGFVAGVFSGLIAGVILTNFANDRERKLNEEFALREELRDRALSEEQQRLENLRFIRDVSTREDSAMPFQGLDLRGMDLSSARLGCRDEGYSLEGVCTLRADFTGADLSRADMRYMDLTGADFTGANLEGTKLDGSRLTAANLTAARNLGEAELGGVCYESGNAAIWPEELRMPDSMAGNLNSPVCNPGI